MFAVGRSLSDPRISKIPTMPKATPPISRKSQSYAGTCTGMPGMDGYDLMRRVRALQTESGAKFPAVALTAFARSEDRTRALLAGFVAHVAKPVEAPELIATIAAVTGRTV
jgi:DNA-binding NarL/FixJ family response regulator